MHDSDGIAISKKLLQLSCRLLFIHINRYLSVNRLPAGMTPSPGLLSITTGPDHKNVPSVPPEIFPSKRLSSPAASRS